ncbi:MAG: hypothetical protein LBE97_01875, partial [Holosporales bacterium]|nr:hypothetical protein [Holosporales bacterium]
MLISGCVPVIIGGGAIGGSCLAIRDKKIGESLSDTKLETVIKARLYKISPELYSAVSVSVDQGNVLLTG